MKSLRITIKILPGARAGGAGRAARAFGGQLEEEVAAAAEVAQLMGNRRRFMAQTPYLMVSVFPKAVAAVRIELKRETMGIGTSKGHDMLCHN